MALRNSALRSRCWSTLLPLGREYDHISICYPSNNGQAICVQQKACGSIPKYGYAFLCITAEMLLTQH
jgi:hypothetical protein